MTMHRTFTHTAWSILLLLLGSLLLFSSIADGQSTTSNPLPTTDVSSGPATEPATGTSTGPLPTNLPGGGNQTLTTSAGPRPTRSPTAPVARLTVIEPRHKKDDPAFYAIGSNIQFSWTIDANLLLTPANITIDCHPRGDNRNIYTIGVLPAGATNYTWTGAQQTANQSHPLQEKLYTLRIYDGQVVPGGGLPTDGGGYLLPNSDVTFGLYSPENYNNAACDCSSPDVAARCGRCAFSAVTNNAHRGLSPAGASWMFSVVAVLAGAASFVF